MPIVVISRPLFSGGELLAEHLGHRLSVNVLSREVLIEAAKKYGVSESDLYETLDQPSGFLKQPISKKEHYILAVRAMLTEMFPEGIGVYHGYAGQFLLEGLNGVLKLRLVAPLEYRIRSAMIELNISRDQAQKQIHHADENRRKWVHQLYEGDWDDPSLYDVTINLASMSVETATELVVDLLGRPEYKRTPEYMRRYRDYALKLRIQAELAFHSKFSETDVEVEVNHGVVNLSGGLTFESNKEEIFRFVRGIKGVELINQDDEHKDLKVQLNPDRVRWLDYSKARDIMLPPDRYPSIHNWTTIREAYSAMATSVVQFEDGHVIHPRYVLVFDEKDRLEGILSRRGLLRGLLPRLPEIEKIGEHFAGFIPDDATSFPASLVWEHLFSSNALEKAEEPVKTILTPIKGMVEPNDPISVVITTAIQHRIDLVPVVLNHKIVGVILMTDLFDAVAEFIIERGGKE